MKPPRKVVQVLATRMVAHQRCVDQALTGIPANRDHFKWQAARHVEIAEMLFGTLALVAWLPHVGQSSSKITLSVEAGYGENGEGRRTYRVILTADFVSTSISIRGEGVPSSAMRKGEDASIKEFIAETIGAWADSLVYECPSCGRPVHDHDDYNKCKECRDDKEPNQP